MLDVRVGTFADVGAPLLLLDEPGLYGSSSSAETVNSFNIYKERNNNKNSSLTS